MAAMKSRRPYLLPGLYEWIVDSGCTCHIMLDVNYSGVDIPEGLDKDGRLVLDISPAAIRNLDFDAYFMSFLAQFDRVTHEIAVPYGAVMAIMGVESGEHISFEDDADPSLPPGSQGHLQIIK